MSQQLKIVGEQLWNRIGESMERVEQRLRRTVSILDMIQVGIIDESWLSRFPTPLAERLKSLLDNPEQ